MKKKGNPFSIRSRVESFRYAFCGLRDMLETEHNAWVHALATILALGLAWWLNIDRNGFVFIIIAIVMVWVAEVFNTVLEILADLVRPESYSKSVRRAKDIAAAAVLIASMGAIGIGIVILWPPFSHRIVLLFS